MSSSITYFPSNPSLRLQGTEAVDAPSGSAGAPEPLSTLLPEPKGGVDIGMAIAQMAIESAYSTRKQARVDRQQANAALISAQEAQIVHLTEEAEKRFDAARIGAFATIGEGLAGVSGGLVTAGLGASSSSLEDPLAQERRGGAGSAIGAFGKLGSGVAGFVSADVERGSELAGVAAKADEMEATAQKNRLEDANDELKEAREHIRSALDFLREFQSTESKVMASAIRG